MSKRIETGRDEHGTIFADVFSSGRHLHRLTSTGLRPFESEEEARKAAQERVKRDHHRLFR